MANITAKEVHNLPDFMPAYMWSVNYSAAFGGSTAGFFNQLCKTSALPNRTENGTVETMLHGHKRRDPAVESLAGTVSLNFVEAVTAEIIDMVESSRNGQWNRDTGHAKPVSEKGKMTMKLMGRDGSPIKTYTLDGVWFESFEYGTDLSNGEGSEMFSDLSITVSYDFFTF